MYKLIHIHNDFKFFHDTLRYNNPLVYNEIIFIGEVDDLIIGRLQNLQLPYHIFNITEVDKILEMISVFDGIVFYSLNRIKIDILSKIDKNKKVFLRLFGYELYSLKRNKYLSKESLELSIPILLSKYSFKGYLKRKIKRKLGLEFRINLQQQKELYSKINAILLVNRVEYDELKKDFYLPKFIQVPLTRETPKISDLSNKKNEIIIGNSRSSWNNHLDVFRIIKKSKRFNDYKFNLFFNYGADNDYTEKVRNKANQNSFVLIEDFLDIQEFSRVYNTATALIINSYRQHALGNIFTAILSGTKVYLNKKSSTYTWLKQEGFYISEINELPRDIDNNKIMLTQEEYQYNINCYNKMRSNYTKINFIENVITVLKNE